MPNETRELVRFGEETDFEDLPHEVRHEAKRVFLDSVGCALGGITVDKGRFSIQFARGLGAGTESTIFGTGDRVSSAAAAFANGELINALDMDAILAPAHVSPFVIPASLALAESRGACGKDLIMAIALGHEISTRIGRALVTMIVDKDGEFKPAEVHGFSSAIIGGAMGAGKVLKLDSKKMLHSVGIAGHMAPVAAEAKWRTTAPSGMDKYLSAGLISFAEVTAALLAEMGYTGDPTVLEGELGFWKFFGAKAWRPQNLLHKLGKEWLFLETSYKPYPCCRLIHGTLDCFLEIIEENHLMPEDIQSVVALGHPLAIAPVWNNTELATHVDAQFSLPYAFAVVAHRIPTIDWQEARIMKDPNILEFMKKVSFDSHPDFGRVWLQDHRHNLSSIEVIAKGQTYKRETLWARGDYFLEEARMKDEELEEKFRDNASRTLRPEKIDKAVRAVFGLEEIHDISELLPILSQ